MRFSKSFKAREIKVLVFSEWTANGAAELIGDMFSARRSNQVVLRGVRIQDGVA